MTPTLCVDLDGVLANFNEQFARLLEDLYDLRYPITDPTWPAVWHWPQAGGATDAQLDAAWRSVHQSKDFWLDLPAMPTGREALVGLLRLRSATNARIYFTTKRDGGFLTQVQTAAWIERHGYPYPSVVLVPPEATKGAIFSALHATHVIDDRYEYAVEAGERGMRSYLVHGPYNETTPAGPFLRAQTALDAVQAIRNDQIP